MRHLFLAPIAAFALSLNAQNPVRVDVQLWSPPVGFVVDIAHCGDDRLFVVGQDGYILIMPDSGQLLSRPFLDIHAQVDFIGEKGLLGLAFAPDYATSGFFYTHYVAPVGPGRSIVSRWHVSADPDSADAASERIIYQLDQPYVNHNGGDLDFGPDGMLYIGFGDGGSGGDPDAHAQNLTDPLGDMLRIDVGDPDTTYTVPPDNPYVSANNDTLPEIFASGLRNPYRFGFDRLTGDLWIGDVGQNAWEEWDFWPAGDLSGANFGWRCYEGDVPYDTTGCQAQSFYTGPAVVKANDANGGVHCAAVGGRVYRGTAFPHMYGRYFYTDFCAPQINNLRPDGSGGWITERSMITPVTAWSVIAENAAGELFAGNLGEGRVYRIVDRCPMDPPAVVQNGAQLESSAATAYQWFLNGDTLPGATAQVYVPLVSGDYHVVGDYGSGCLLSSDTLAFIFTGLGAPGVKDLTISPIPANESITVAWAGGSVARFEVCDATGACVLQGPVTTDPLHINTERLPAGAYVLHLRAAQRAVIGAARLVVAR